MVKVLDAHVRDWGPEYTNLPDLCVLVESLPPDDAFVWNYRDDIHAFWAQHEGIIRYLFHDGTDENLGGFFGASFTLRMSDGTTKTIRGPWSGDPRVFWRLKDRPMEPVSVVVFVGRPTVKWWQDRIGISGYCLDLTFARRVVKWFCPGYYLAWNDDGGFVPKKV